MLHYNYSTSLSHFLNYHQLEEQFGESEPAVQNTCEDISQQEDPRCRSNSSATAANKSFTIAAILGLKTSDQEDPGGSPTAVVNLSVHHPERSRLPLPARHNGAVGHFQVGHGCTQRQMRAGLKHHLSAGSAMQAKKNCKSKRVRTIFTPEQLERLEAEFERQQYMVGPERLYLAHTLQLTEAQVKVWFQNRRIKWRKHHLELTHQRLAVLKQQQLLLGDDSTPDAQDTNSSSTDT